MKRLKIYVAGPYTHPDPCINTRKAMDIGHLLMNMGYVPYVPHLCHFWHSYTPFEYEQWIEYGLEWLKVCDAVFVLKGKSKGVQIEIKEARKLGIPVYFSLKELLDAKSDENKDKKNERARGRYYQRRKSVSQKKANRLMGKNGWYYV